MAKTKKSANTATAVAKQPTGLTKYLQDVPVSDVKLYPAMHEKLALPANWDMGVPGADVLEPLAREIGQFEHIEIALSPNAHAGKLPSGHVGFFFMHSVPGGELILTDPLGNEQKVKPAKGTLAIVNGFSKYRFDVTPAPLRGVAILYGFPDVN